MAVTSDPRRPGGREELLEAEASLTRAIARWEGLLRAPRRDRVQLRRLRAQASIAINDLALGKLPEKAVVAVQDWNEVIRVLEEDMPAARFTFDYSDAFVRRGLAKEEVAYGRKDPKQWAAAVDDYSRAIELWRVPPASGIKGLGVNPLVLNYRGNALSRLGRFDEAYADYREATLIFVELRDKPRASLSRANEGLALFGADRRDEAVLTMAGLARKEPRLVDPRVALAAAYWARGEPARAEEQWRVACEETYFGCNEYKDLAWVSEIRRWPPALVSSLAAFFKLKAP